MVPWYAAVYAQHGWTYIVSFFIGENLGRYTNAMTPGGRGVLFYIPVLLGGLFPWAPLVLVPLWQVAAEWWRPSATGGGRAALRRLLWLWIVVFVAVFSFSRTKEDLYIFPVVPAVAALVADALVERVEGGRARALGAVFIVVCGLCLVVAPAAYWLFGPSAGYYAMGGASTFAVVLGTTGLAAGLFWLRGRPATGIAALGAGFVVLNYLFVAQVLPQAERSKPVPPLARTLAADAAPDARVGSFNMGLQSFVYYSGRSAIAEIDSLDEARTFFAGDREAWAIMGGDEWTEVQRAVPGTCVAAERHLSIFDAKLGDIITRTPPPAVLLVKNRCH